MEKTGHGAPPLAPIFGIGTKEGAGGNIGLVDDVFDDFIFFRWCSMGVR